MKINEQEFNKSTELLKGVRLAESEKASMLTNIYQTEMSIESQSVPSPFIFSSLFMRQRVMVVMASFVLIATGGGYAAASSLPGGPLYGIKVNVLEPLALGLTFDEVEKNEYKIELLQRRVAELEELRLNSAIDLESEKDSYHAAERNIAELEASAIFDDSGINVDVKTSVETYNSLISESFRLETKIMKNRLMPEKEDEEEGEDEEDNDKGKEETMLQKDTERIEEVVTETNKSLEEIDKDIKEVRGTIKGKMDETLKETIIPISKRLGF